MDEHVKRFEDSYKFMLNREVTLTVGNIQCDIMYDVEHRVLYYLIKFAEFNPEWKKIFKYHKLNSDAFLIPKTYLDMTKQEKLRCSFTFIIDNVIYYIISSQLLAFCEGNKLETEINKVKVCPVPFILLTKNNPYDL